MKIERQRSSFVRGDDGSSSGALSCPSHLLHDTACPNCRSINAFFSLDNICFEEELTTCAGSQQIGLGSIYYPTSVSNKICLSINKPQESPRGTQPYKKVEPINLLSANKNFEAKHNHSPNFLKGTSTKQKQFFGAFEKNKDCKNVSLDESSKPEQTLRYGYSSAESNENEEKYDEEMHKFKPEVCEHLADTPFHQKQLSSGRYSADTSKLERILRESGNTSVQTAPHGGTTVPRGGKTPRCREAPGLNRFPLIFRTSPRGSSRVRLLAPDGRTAVVEGPEFAGFSSAPLPVVYAPGSRDMVDGGGFVEAHVVPVSGGVNALYVGRLSLPGGGGSFSFFHHCKNYTVYHCDCGFYCPEKRCQRCCNHKNHKCLQQQKEKDTLKANTARVGDEYIEAEMDNAKSHFSDLFESISVEAAQTKDGMNAKVVQIEAELENDGVSSQWEQIDETDGEFLSESTVLGYLPHFNSNETPPALKLPKIKSVFETKIFSSDFSTDSIQNAPYTSNAKETHDNTMMKKKKENRNVIENQEENELDDVFPCEIFDRISVEKLKRLWNRVIELRCKENERQDLLNYLLNGRNADPLQLIDVCRKLQIVLETGLTYFVLDCDTKNYLRMKKIWIEKCLLQLLQFSDEERSNLAGALVETDWSCDMYDILIKAIDTESEYLVVLEFINFLQRLQIPDAILLHSILYDVKCDGQGSRIKRWTDNINYQILCNNICLTYPIIEGLSPVLYTYIVCNYSMQSVYNFIKNNSELIQSKRGFQDFYQILLMLQNYQVEKSTSEKALEAISNAQWREELDKIIVSHVFQDVLDCDVDKIINDMVLYPNTITEEYKQRLKGNYELLFSALKKPINENNSTIVNKLAASPISSWDKKDIVRWAIKFRLKKIETNLTGIIAIVTRAVKLHFNIVPKCNQILSLLVLLDSGGNKGRLAQINTGEGKSLIIAMLAAVLALRGRTVDVITTSSDLARREAKINHEFFDMLTLSVAENSADSKKSPYLSNILYGTACNFVGDILRDEFLGQDVICSRTPDVIIADEVDGMFYDSRACYVRLSQNIPGMNHLRILLGAIWEFIHRIAYHIVIEDGKSYFVANEHLLKEKEQGRSVCKWESVGLLIENERSFIISETENHITKLIECRDEEEEKEYKEYQEKFAQIESTFSDETDSEDRNNHLLELQKLPWVTKNRYPKLDIPKHLQRFAESQIPFWVKNALDAACVYKLDAHYAIQEDRIVPIHYDENGEFQMNLVWSDALTQFLQIKEGLPVDPESISTNYLSYAIFFKRYKTIFGASGTLGELSTWEFLHETYNVDLVIIPPQKYINILDNRGSPYLCKELAPIIVRDSRDWYEAAVANSLHHACQKRASLIICRYVFQVRKIIKLLEARYAKEKIFDYTGHKTFTKSYVKCGEIIVATNIAGRGFDLKPTKEVESNGGLCVIITFHPKSYRVEMQNAGRTGRQGNKGMVQLIILDSKTKSLGILKEERRQQEISSCDRARSDVDKVIVQDELFKSFQRLEKRLLPSYEDSEMELKLIQLQNNWNNFLKQRNAGILDNFLISLENFKGKQLNKNSSSSDSQTISEEISKALLSVLKEKLAVDNEKWWDTFIKQTGETLSPRIVEQLKKGEFQAQKRELASKYNWGCFERLGLEERWAIWLRGKHFEAHNNFFNAVSEFKNEFQQKIENDALNNKLIENPYYYVLKGNEHYDNAMENSESKNLILQSAIICYNKAILMDPSFSTVAKYNKACALLSFEVSNNELKQEALNELKQCKQIIKYKLKTNLFAFNMFIGQTSKETKTHCHTNHQLNILSQQEEFIDEAVKVLGKAIESNRNIVLTRISLKQACELFQEDHSKAIKEESANGLEHFFTIREVLPFPWITVLVLAAAAAFQVFGALMLVFSAPHMTAVIIAEVLSDVIKSLRNISTGEFRWRDWLLTKTAFLALSVMSAGWANIANVVSGLRLVKLADIAAVSMSTLKTVPEIISNSVKYFTEDKTSTLSSCFSDANNMSAYAAKRDNIVNDIVGIVSAVFNSTLLKDKDLQDALKLDETLGQNYWQEKYVMAAEKLLSNPTIASEEETLQKRLRGELNERGRNKCNMSLQLREDVTNYLETLLNDYKKSVTGQLKSKIDTAKNSHKYVERATELLKGKKENSNNRRENGKEIIFGMLEYTSDKEPQPQTEEINSKNLKEGFKRLNPNYGIALQDRLLEMFSSKMTARLCQKMCLPDKTLPQIADNLLKETNKIDEAVREFMEKISTPTEIQDSEGTTKSKPEEESRSNATSSRNAQYLSEEAKEAVQQMHSGLPMSCATIALVSKALGLSLLVFEDERGKLLHLEGNPLRGRPIMLKVRADNGRVLLNDCVPLHEDFAVSNTPEGPTFLEIVWSQLDSVKKEEFKDVEGLCKAVIQTMLDDPWEANRLFEKY